MKRVVLKGMENGAASSSQGERIYIDSSKGKKSVARKRWDMNTTSVANREETLLFYIIIQ